jgi:hypothetical protein
VLTASAQEEADKIFFNNEAALWFDFYQFSKRGMSH